MKHEIPRSQGLNFEIKQVYVLSFNLNAINNQLVNLEVQEGIQTNHTCRSVRMAHVILSSWECNRWNHPPASWHTGVVSLKTWAVSLLFDSNSKLHNLEELQVISQSQLLGNSINSEALHSHGVLGWLLDTLTGCLPCWLPQEGWFMESLWKGRELRSWSWGSKDADPSNFNSYANATSCFIGGVQRWVIIQY